MISRITKSFRQRLELLPQSIQSQAKQAYQIFRANPHHPGLRFKKVWTNPPIYSVRVGIGYRAVGVLHGEIVIWYWIGTHAEYDRLLEQLP